MYEIDPKPNSDQEICDNCEIIVDEKLITETIDGESGCTECISRCVWCGNYYFSDNVFSSPYFGPACKSCLNGEEYRKATKQEVIKEALRCYFDQTNNRQVEGLIIDVAKEEGFLELAHKLKNDKS